MARNESQGLQIAVILLTMCVVGLAIFTWVFFQSADKNFKLAEAAKKSADDVTKSRELESYKAKVYKYIVGSPDVTLADINDAKGRTGGDTAADAALAEHDKLIKDLEAQIPTEAKHGLSHLPPYLTKTVIDRNKGLTAAADRETNLNKDKVATEQREQKRAETAEQGMAKAAEDLTEEREKFNQERQDFKKQQDELAAQIVAKDKQMKEQKELADKEVAEFTKRIDVLQTENEILRRKLAQSTKDGPDFEVPDGEITWVSQRQRRAWINVGYADGLMRQTTFSVYDYDENGVSSAKRKARLEVIEVTQPHMAECRILEDDIKNPILPGDKIFTPAWSPGQHLHFALSGNIDIDGDGRPDNEEVKNIIQLNGGEVDAEVTPSGRRTGQVSEQTRYLIRGKPPSERELSADEGNKALAEYSRMNQEAETSGTEVIDVSRFLALMGWKAQERTTSLGNKRTTRRGEKKAAAEAPATETPAEDAAPMSDPDVTTEEPAPKTKPAEDENPFDDK